MFDECGFPKTPASIYNNKFCRCSMIQNSFKLSYLIFAVKKLNNYFAGKLFSAKIIIICNSIKFMNGMLPILPSGKRETW